MEIEMEMERKFRISRKGKNTFYTKVTLGKIRPGMIKTFFARTIYLKRSGKLSRSKSRYGTFFPSCISWCNKGHYLSFKTLPT